MTTTEPCPRCRATAPSGCPAIDCAVSDAGRAAGRVDDVNSTDPIDRIVEATDVLGADELELLALIASRLALGRKYYGELNVTADPRDFAHEALDEAADGLIYTAAALIKQRRPEP